MTPDPILYLKKMLPRARRLIRPKLGEVSIAVVGDTEMARLHRKFMGIKGPTDVLTFEMEEAERSGEIVLCLPEARRQARARGTKVEHELLLYTIHGMLHLSGWDDRTPAAYKKMHRKEDQILRKLGVGTVFARPERANLTSRDRKGAVLARKTAPLRSRLVRQNHPRRGKK